MCKQPLPRGPGTRCSQQKKRKQERIKGELAATVEHDEVRIKKTRNGVIEERTVHPSKGDLENFLATSNVARR